MKTRSCSVWLAASLAPCFILGLCRSALADVALNAPGVPIGSQSATAVPFRNTLTLPNCYKFIFSGTEARGTTTGAPGSSGTQGNGGLVLFKAFVSSSNCGSGSSNCGHSGSSCGSGQANAIQLTFTNIQTYNSSPLKTLTLTPSASFVGETGPINVDLVWQGEGNGKKPTGFFNILGEYQKAPPIPTGSLTFPDGMWELKKSTSNPNPKGTALIVRQ
ncbi:MAG: hypothetical protein WCO60_10620 [Verrucomicrobiota bacterium]